MGDSRNTASDGRNIVQAGVVHGAVNIGGTNSYENCVMGENASITVNSGADAQKSKDRKKK